MNLVLRTAKKKTCNNKYNFKTKDIGVAGICPDCNGIITFNSYHQRYQCTTKDCCFEADIKKEKVWDNKKREENLQKLKTNLSL